MEEQLLHWHGLFPINQEDFRGDSIGSGALLSSRRLSHLFGDSVLHGAVQSPALPNLPQQVCLLHVRPFSRAAVHHRNRRTGLADKAVCQAITAWTEVRFAAVAQSKVGMRGFPSSEALDMLIPMSPEGSASADLRLNRIAVEQRFERQQMRRGQLAV